MSHRRRYVEWGGEPARGAGRADTQILEPNQVFWNLDLAPDGRRFVIPPRPEATGGQKSSAHVTVLLNLFDELRRRRTAK